MNQALAGQSDFATFSDMIESAAGVPVAGNDVRLTTDSRIQAAAEEALEGYSGAIVVIDPRTGAILAEASSPGYNPNTIDTDWASLNATGSGAPLVDRANRALYPPGSTFKIVTLTAALASGLATPDSTFSGPASITIGGAAITNYGGTSYGTITLRKATASSVNTVYAQIAHALGPEALVNQAEGFGFDSTPPSDIPTVASLMPDPAEMTDWETAWAGVGQPVGEHESPAGPQTTALQMALVASGIANDGVVMRPYLVSAVTDRASQVITQTTPRPWRTATNATTADTVTSLMVSVVQSGSGSHAAIPGVTVAGKTGTAEVGKTSQTHAWFIGFAPAENPRVAIAVVLENAGVGGTVAAPIAREVLDVALEATQ